MKLTHLLSLTLIAALLPATVQGQASSFTYQGQLRQSGEHFIGMADLEFRLYDQLSGGTQIGSPQSLNAVPVEDGLFQVELDFGPTAFNGSDRFLEVTVDGAPLSPRQPVTATPYALLAAGLSAGAVGAGSVDPTEVQLRIVGICPTGEYVQEINQDGSVICGVDANSGSSGTVTQIDTGAGLAGGPITETGTISVAPGGIGSTEVDGTQIQLRVMGTCPAGEYVQELNGDGTVVCGTDADSGGTVTEIQTGAGLTGGPISTSGTVAVAPGGIGAVEIDTSQVQARINGDCPAGLFLQQVNPDGSVVCAADALGNDWRLGGNAGTDPDMDFVGTTDARALEFRTANARSLRIEPSAESFNGLPITANVVAGSSVNEILSGVRGATISGGGIPTGDSDPDYPEENPNRVTDHYGTVGGGYGNTAGDDSGHVDDRVSATVAGGIDNHGSGSLSAISGGLGNRASGRHSAIGGGLFNEATDADSTIGGGRSNDASGPLSTIGGGEWNAASGGQSMIGGGAYNTASGPDSTIGGGSENTASSASSSVAGGWLNEAGGTYSAVGGGALNIASGAYTSISGGRDNEASGERSGIGGGGSNQAGGGWSRVSGGALNAADGDFSTVGGGQANQASGENSTISGGQFHLAGGPASTISGGEGNRASGVSSTVSGGVFNEANGAASTVSGGSGNCAGGARSWAGGLRAKVRPRTGASFPQTSACDSVPNSGDGDGDHGTFVWADSTDTDFISTGPNQFLVRAEGGVGLGTNSPRAQLHVTEALNASADSPGNHVAIIENTAASTGNGPDVLALKTSAISPSSTSNFITFFDGNDDPVGRIDGDGSGGVVLQSGGADVAEWLPKRDPEEDIEPGDVVGWHADGISRDTRGALRVMVVSTQPIVAGNAPPEDQLDQWTRVGFIGQVPVRVRGPVEAGNWVVASGERDGTGIARSPEGLSPDQLRRVIGQALESNARKGEHRINVAIGLGAHEPYSEALVRLHARNTKLQKRLVDAEDRFETRLEVVERQQRHELTALRQELALLRELVAPRVAQKVNR